MLKVITLSHSHSHATDLVPRTWGAPTLYDLIGYTDQSCISRLNLWLPGPHLFPVEITNLCSWEETRSILIFNSYLQKLFCKYKISYTVLYTYLAQNWVKLSSNFQILYRTIEVLETWFYACLQFIGKRLK